MSELGYLWKNFWNLQGRCGPTQFWRAGLSASVLSWVLLSPATWFLFHHSPAASSTEDFKGVGRALTMLAAALYSISAVLGGFLLYMMMFSLCRRRANDIGLTPRLPDALNMMVAHFAASSLLVTLPFSLASSALSPAISLFLFLVLTGFGAIFLFGSFRSQPGTNPYGPNPSEASK